MHRLPAEVRTRFPDPQLLMAQGQPSGVRLVFSTTAEQLEVVTHPTPVVYLGWTVRAGSWTCWSTARWCTAMS